MSSSSYSASALTLLQQLVRIEPLVYKVIVIVIYRHASHPLDLSNAARPSPPPFFSSPALLLSLPRTTVITTTRGCGRENVCAGACFVCTSEGLSNLVLISFQVRGSSFSDARAPLNRSRMNTQFRLCIGSVGKDSSATGKGCTERSGAEDAHSSWAPSVKNNMCRFFFSVVVEPVFMAALWERSICEHRAEGARLSWARALRKDGNFICTRVKKVTCDG
jgi:hypothetical protein